MDSIKRVLISQASEGLKVSVSDELEDLNRYLGFFWAEKRGWDKEALYYPGPGRHQMQRVANEAWAFLKKVDRQVEEIKKKVSKTGANAQIIKEIESMNAHLHTQYNKYLEKIQHIRDQNPILPKKPKASLRYLRNYTSRI